MVRGLQGCCRGLRHLRTPSIRRNHQLSHCRQQAGLALGFGYGSRRSEANHFRADAVAGRRGELTYAQRSRRRQLAIRQGLRHGHGLHSYKCQGLAPGCAGRNAPGEICGKLPKGFDPKTYETRPWKITSYLHDGDHIDLGGRSVEIIATPGHTPDAIALLDRDNGLLFTGDTIPRPSGCIVPKRISTLRPLRFAGWQC